MLHRIPLITEPIAWVFNHTMTAGTVLAVGLGYWLADIASDINSKIWVGLAAGAFSAICVGAPKLIIALAQSRKVNSELIRSEFASVIEQLNVTQAALLTDNARKEAKIESLRLSKHAVLNDRQQLLFHIAELEQIMRDKGLVPPKLKVTPLSDLMKDEDVNARANVRQAAQQTDG
jgi:hypothetical protein